MTKKLILTFFCIIICYVNIFAKQWVIIYAEKISQDAPVGHAFASFIQEDIFQKQTKIVGCWGFYPRIIVPQAIWGTVPSELRDDWKTHRDYTFLVEVNSEEFNHCLRIKELYKSKLEYSLNGQNCVNFIRDIISAITKLNQPEKSILKPSSLVKEVKRLNRNIEIQSEMAFINSIGNQTNTERTELFNIVSLLATHNSMNTSLTEWPETNKTGSITWKSTIPQKSERHYIISGTAPILVKGKSIKCINPANEKEFQCKWNVFLKGQKEGYSSFVFSIDNLWVDNKTDMIDFFFGKNKLTATLIKADNFSSLYWHYKYKVSIPDKKDLWMKIIYECRTATLSQAQYNNFTNQFLIRFGLNEKEVDD